MRIDTLEDHTIRLSEVFNSICLETEEGNRLNICMRDDTFEMSVRAKGTIGDIPTWRINMETGEIYPMDGGIEASDDPEPADIEMPEYRLIESSGNMPLRVGDLDPNLYIISCTSSGTSDAPRFEATLGTEKALNQYIDNQ